MELDSFFGTPKWRILELLAEKSLSPSELSLNLGTSIAYVSQQLKLLEVAGLIIKQKTSNALKGKPRSLYSLSREILSLAVLTNGWSSKKVVNLTNHHKTILRIWFLENASLHYPIEKAYLELDRYLNEIDGIFFSNDLNNEVIVVTEFKGLKSKVGEIIKGIKQLNFSFTTRVDFLKNYRSNIFSIYDPHMLYLELKGVSL